jgi:ribose transport system substrate-binding protein
MVTRNWVSRGAGVGLVAILLAAGCGGSDTGAGSTGGTTPGGGGDRLQMSVDATARARKGTNRPVDPTPRAAVKDKRIAVISAGQVSMSSAVPANAAMDAAAAVGWKAELYDAALDPSKYPQLIRQAVAAGVDGIVLSAIDCQAAKQAIQEAKAKGLVVVSIYGFDCNDPKAGAEPEGLFNQNLNFGPAAKDVDGFTKTYGADQANYVIADSGNTAKVIVLNDPEFTVLKWTYEGFTETVGASGGSEVVSTLEITVSDLTSNAIVAKVQAELLRHPEATWIKSPFTYATTIGIVPALLTSGGRQIKVMGGEGFAAELDLIRQGKVTAAALISSEWSGWAAIDTVNSSFRKETAPDSGIGWTIIDKDSALPPEGQDAVPPIDFKASFKKVWGVG